jgi:hypothetical protein
MGNADEADDYDQAPPTPRCGYCREPMIDQHRGQMYCGRRCKELAREKRKRDRARVDALREKYPAADFSLEELYARAILPRPAVSEDHGDEAGHLDDEDDEYRHEADEGPGAWSDAWRLQEAIERMQRRYERRIQPYLVQLKRNPGVRPPGLVELERERDEEIARIVRKYSDEADLYRARRNEPKRINEAHERRGERASLQALAQDLPGASRRYTPATSAGRATDDIWRW